MTRSYFHKTLSITLSTLFPSIITFSIVDLIAIITYLILPLHSKELELTDKFPLGIILHIFSHVSLEHLINNITGLLIIPFILFIFEYNMISSVVVEDLFIKLIRVLTVPIFILTSILGSDIAYISYAIIGKEFWIAGLSDGVYGIFAGYLLLSILLLSQNFKMIRKRQGILSSIYFGINVLFLSLLILNAKDNLGHSLGVLSAVPVTYVGYFLLRNKSISRCTKGRNY